jgi:hypothetical protein
MSLITNNQAKPKNEWRNQDIGESLTDDELAHAEDIIREAGYSHPTAWAYSILEVIFKEMIVSDSTYEEIARCLHEYNTGEIK